MWRPAGTSIVTSCAPGAKVTGVPGMSSVMWAGKSRTSISSESLSRLAESSLGVALRMRSSVRTVTLQGPSNSIVPRAIILICSSRERVSAPNGQPEPTIRSLYMPRSGFAHGEVDQFQPAVR